MREYLREFNKYRGLFWMITYRDIKVRYKQSVMGFLWAILMPVLIVMSGIVVRYAYAFAAHGSINKADVASVAVKVPALGVSCLQYPILVQQSYEQ